MQLDSIFTDTTGTLILSASSTRTSLYECPPEDSSISLLALIDQKKQPQIHGHPIPRLRDQTAAQIAPVLTKEMMTTPTISLAMMSLMQTLAQDDSSDMSAPRAALLKRMEKVAITESGGAAGDDVEVTAHLPSAGYYFILPPCQSPKLPRRSPT